MSRQARLDAPGVLQHVICRGIERRDIFADDVDREDFVGRLTTVLADTGTRCYAWALIPNHFHLLLRTGETPLGSVMRRLLTGYAVTFNRRHARSGHLFQNRYKSILCQEDAYLLELLRYLHLNPLRAGLVDSLEGLADYPFCGHRQLMGQAESTELIDADFVLSLFGRRAGDARKKYLAWLAKGVEQGKRPELTGGGLTRSLIGSKTALEDICGDQPGDVRILGNGDFAARMLTESGERLDKRQRLRFRGIDLDRLAGIVAQALGLELDEVWAAGRKPERVLARSLLCFWAVRELGLTTTGLARRLGLSQPAISLAVQRGERLAREKGLILDKLIN